MKPIELTVLLARAKDGNDFVAEAEAIFQDVTLDGPEVEFSRAILIFMEQNPDLDFGTPGPLVHFVERFYGKGYEAELLISIARKPTSHTVWMLNRLINGTKEPSVRLDYINALCQVAEHLLADEETKNIASHFYNRITS